MKKLILILSIILTSALPIITLAQFDYLDDMINEDIPEENIGIEEEITTAEDSPNLIDIDMVWSADSFVPYDYLGRALPAEGGWVNVDVIMELSGGKPESLKYSWFVDDNFEESKSGYGKTSFTFGIIRMSGSTHTVLVKIFNESRSFYLEKSIIIPIVNPEIIIYPSPKNQKFSEQAKKNISTINNKEFLFIAKPFYFSIKRPADLSYRWDFSDQKAITSSGYGANTLKITVPQKNTAESVEKNLSIMVTNNINLIQKAFKTLKIQID
jgi:hypothetical protein